MGVREVLGKGHEAAAQCPHQMLRAQGHSVPPFHCLQSRRGQWLEDRNGRLSLSGLFVKEGLFVKRPLF